MYAVSEQLPFGSKDADRSYEESVISIQIQKIPRTVIVLGIMTYAGFVDCCLGKNQLVVYFIRAGCLTEQIQQLRNG